MISKTSQTHMHACIQKHFKNNSICLHFLPFCFTLMWRFARLPLYSPLMYSFIYFSLLVLGQAGRHPFYSSSFFSGSLFQTHSVSPPHQWISASSWSPGENLTHTKKLLDTKKTLLFPEYAASLCYNRIPPSFLLGRICFFPAGRRLNAASFQSSH